MHPDHNDFKTNYPDKVLSKTNYFVKLLQMNPKKKFQCKSEECECFDVVIYGRIRKNGEPPQCNDCEENMAEVTVENINSGNYLVYKYCLNIKPVCTILLVSKLLLMLLAKQAYIFTRYPL